MKIDIFDDDAALRYKFTAFLEVTITNAKIDYIRIYVRKYSKEAVVAAITESAASKSDFSEAMAFEEQGFDNEALDTAFGQLPDRMKRVMTCFYLYGMDADEIALVYGYKKSYVYKLKQEALKRLRFAMRQAGLGGDEHG